MFTETDICSLKQNVFTEIGKNWMLVSAKKPDGSINTMTASWGSMGVLWGAETVTVYIRKSRYTKEFIDSGDYFTVSLFDGYKKELGLLGSKSGRDGDKIAEAGLHPIALGDSCQPGFEESKCVFVCRKVFSADMTKENIPSDENEKWYSDSDYHTMYIGKIEACYTK